MRFCFQLTDGGISPSYPYADRLVMDAQPNCVACTQPYSLYDFFDFTTPHSFTPITGEKYPEQCFHTPLPDNGTCFDGSTYPSDPDDDAIESD